jgi:hypothetical protein
LLGYGGDAGYQGEVKDAGMGGDVLGEGSGPVRPAEARATPTEGENLPAFANFGNAGVSGAALGGLLGNSASGTFGEGGVIGQDNLSGFPNPTGMGLPSTQNPVRTADIEATARNIVNESPAVSKYGIHADLASAIAQVEANRVQAAIDGICRSARQAPTITAQVEDTPGAFSWTGGAPSAYGLDGAIPGRVEHAAREAAIQAFTGQIPADANVGTVVNYANPAPCGPRSPKAKRPLGIGRRISTVIRRSNR